MGTLVGDGEDLLTPLVYTSAYTENHKDGQDGQKVSLAMHFQYIHNLIGTVLRV